MKLRQYLVAGFVGAVLAGCASVPLEMTGQNVTVRVDERIVADERKKEAMEDYEMVPWLHRYLTHRFRKLKLRKGLETTVTITSLRLKTGMYSSGTSSITMHVVVTEDGKRLDEFDVSESSIKKKETAVRRMSKKGAEFIYNRIKDL